MIFRSCSRLWVLQTMIFLWNLLGYSPNRSEWCNYPSSIRDVKHRPSMLFHVSGALYFITDRKIRFACRETRFSWYFIAERLPRPRFKLRRSSKAYPIFEKMQIDLRVASVYLREMRSHTHTHVTATVFPLTRGSGCIQSRLKCRFLIAWKPVCTAHRGRYISCRTPRYIAAALLHPSQLPHRCTLMLYACIRSLLFP